MPKQPVRFIFTAEQTQRIQSFFPDFKAEVEKHDPEYEGRNVKITNWKKTKAKELLQERLFANLDNAETQESWQSVRIITPLYFSQV